MQRQLLNWCPVTPLPLNLTSCWNKLSFFFLLLLPFFPFAKLFRNHLLHRGNVNYAQDCIWNIPHYFNIHSLMLGKEFPPSLDVKYIYSTYFSHIELWCRTWKYNSSCGGRLNKWRQLDKLVSQICLNYRLPQLISVFIILLLSSAVFFYQA